MSQAMITPLQGHNYGPIVSALERVLHDMSVTACPAFLGELERIKALTFMKMMANPADSPAPKVSEAGQYLTVEQVCTRYGVQPKWLYRHKKQMPHSQPSRKVLLFPEKAIERWFATRTLRG